MASITTEGVAFSFSTHEMDQLRDQISLPGKLMALGLGVLAPNLQRLGIERRPFTRFHPIPNPMRLAQALRGLHPMKKRLQLGMVRVVVLWVDVPDEGLACP